MATDHKSEPQIVGASVLIVQNGTKYDELNVSKEKNKTIYTVLRFLTNWISVTSAWFPRIQKQWT